MTDELPTPKYIDDSTVREVYAETAQVLFGPPGILRVELCAHRWTTQPPVHIDRMYPVTRFAMGIEAARVLRDHLSRCLELVDKQNQLVQTPAASAAKN